MVVPFEVTVSFEDCPVVAVHGELDAATVDQFEAALASVLPGHAEQLVVDLRDLEFCGSTGLTALVALRRRVGSLRLRNVPELTRRTMELTGLDRILDVGA